MTHVKIPAWLFGALLLIAAGSLFFAWYVGRGNSDLRDDVERLQTGIRAARDSQRVLVGQLGDLSLDYIGLEEEFRGVLDQAELDVERINSLESEIENSRNAGRLLGESIGRIGDFIEQVDRLNQERPDA